MATSFPALSIGQNQPDLGRTLATVATLRNAETQNALLRQRMAREQEATGIRRQLFEDPAVSAETPEIALDGGMDPSAARPAGAGIKVNNAMMKRLLAIDPAGGAQLMTALDKMDDRQRTVLLRQNEDAAKLLMGVETLPMEQRPAAYQTALATAQRMGIPTANAPKEYDPVWSRQTIGQAMTLEQHLAQRKADAAEKKPVVVGGALVRPDTGEEIYKGQPNALYQFLNGLDDYGNPTVLRGNRQTGDVDQTGVKGFGSGRGAGGAGGQTERLIAAIRSENPDMSYADALALVKFAPRDQQVSLAKERLAGQQAKADERAYRTDPVGTLNKYRQMYGLPPLEKPPEAPKKPEAPGLADRLKSAFGGGAGTKPVAPASQAEFDALPSGTLFVNPSDGKTYRKK